MIEEEKKSDTPTQEISVPKKKLQNEKRGRVFIRNLPFTVNEEKLRTLFGKFGEITEVC